MAFALDAGAIDRAVEAAQPADDAVDGGADIGPLASHRGERTPLRRQSRRSLRRPVCRPFRRDLRRQYDTAVRPARLPSRGRARRPLRSQSKPWTLLVQTLGPSVVQGSWAPPPTMRRCPRLHKALFALWKCRCGMPRCDCQGKRGWRSAGQWRAEIARVPECHPRPRFEDATVPQSQVSREWGAVADQGVCSRLAARWGLGTSPRLSGSVLKCQQHDVKSAARRGLEVAAGHGPEVGTESINSIVPSPLVGEGQGGGGIAER